MGITGLIPFLEKASSKVHLKDIRGSTVAVDTYCWLHKGAFGCAEKLARGEDTDQYMQYCMRYVELLLSYDIKPILVFDGRHLPAKELTERRRRESRKQSRKLAAELLRAGDKEGARTHMRRCVDVTHEMALRVIRECRLRNVDCIVAPYEADAQMAWLNKIDVAQYVITEDSDLTLFGASRIIFKLDLTGAGLLVEADKLYLAMGCTKERYNFDKFRRMCILSGCDYLDSLPGIGLAKACKFMLKTEQDDMWKALKKLPTYLNMKNLQVDDEYIEQFLKAEATFKHMYIYNPFARRMERLHDLSEFETDERFCSNAGTPLEDDEQALQLALGNLNPFTLKQLDNWHPDRNFGQAQANNNKIKRAKHKSIWQGNYQPRTSAPASTDAFKDVKCALHFRKVDFISKTIDEEITENARVEHAKPEEAEIFSMYQHEAGELIAPSAKRRRYSSESNDNGSDSCIEPETIQNPLPEVAHNTHNPFARPQFTTEASKSVSICENPSLLRVLSPKKALDQTSREKQSQQQEKARAILYDSPSPKKKCKLTLETNHAAFNEGTIKTNINKEEEECDSIELIEESKNVAKASVSSLDISHIEDSESKGSLESAITLSDDDDDVGGGFERTIMQTKTSRSSINLFKSQEKQRLGLSRTKAKSTLKSQKASGKSNPKSISTTASLQNQTRLTMFGFKKRPTLK
ncbi:PREDICTED: exonuclease 1 isoform X2 [Rhagoletis zephyria]|uniref:exonuclease 1 isoform X2 n=1 Tax=Rhagoletis zephyria TaxID=28612 RepID=UPI00081174F3|nr:PREDICTED: exonuclease 1 isoform X2 [Rhagoletis zephyria]